MPKRLVLHIGMHKTGSTSIQRFLSRNRALLRALGVLYPRTRTPDGRKDGKHGALFTAISHEADYGAPHPTLGPSARVIDDLASRIEASGARIAILSAEGLSGERDAFARALAPLRDRFEVRVVAFLRRPDLWVESFHRQMILSREVRETRSLRDFIAAPETRAHLDYARMLSWWADAFGDEALRVAPFEPETPGRAPLRLFLRAAGLPSALRFAPAANVWLNPSPPVSEIATIRDANLGRAQGCATCEKSHLTSLELTDDERRQLVENAADGLDEIVERYPFVSDGAFFKRHPSPSI